MPGTLPLARSVGEGVGGVGLAAPQYLPGMIIASPSVMWSTAQHLERVKQEPLGLRPGDHFVICCV